MCVFTVMLLTVIGPPSVTVPPEEPSKVAESGVALLHNTLPLPFHQLVVLVFQVPAPPAPPTPHVKSEPLAIETANNENAMKAIAERHVVPKPAKEEKPKP